MAESKTYYEILHVQRDAPTEVIRATYRTMMQKMKMHPDLGGDQDNAALINEAYRTLIDPEARAQYDAWLLDSTKNPSSQQDVHGNASQATKEQHATTIILDPNQCGFCDLPHQLGATVKPDSVCSRCGSALFPAEKQALEQSGKRIIQRIEKQWPVSFYTHWPITRGYVARTQDVSLNGIQMLSHNLVKTGQIVKLNSHMLDALAVVVNVRNDHTMLRKRWRVGLEFLTLRFHQTQGTFVKIDA